MTIMFQCINRRYRMRREKKRQEIREKNRGSKAAGVVRVYAKESRLPRRKYDSAFHFPIPPSFELELYRLRI